MKKITFEFTENEDGYFDDSEIKDIINTQNMKFFIWDLFQNTLRGRIKYNEELSEEVLDELDKIRDELLQSLEDYNISYVLDG